MNLQSETFQFTAETKYLLDLMIHSLYTTKDIFLRELISNASDAIDRLRFESLLQPELTGDDNKFEIRVDADRTSKTLTISDNGIGMSREEVIANIGTIAKSGTRELREKAKERASQEELANFIGQFGVGFYSSFMVADSIELVTRRAGEETATRWESDGSGHYTLTNAFKARRGTSITLHLKAPEPENGIEDFTDKWILARTVKRYSDFVGYPIVYLDQREEADTAGNEETNNITTIMEDKILNSMKPIWSRPEAEVSESDYVGFYQHIAHDMGEALQRVSLKAEGTLEYRALLFIPAVAPYDLYYHAAEAGLRLYAKGVMITERCADLLPRYLRFIKGVVDSADLPLNISRQMLQQDRHITQMRKWLTKKTLDALQNIHANEADKYLRFWGQFGRALKEGVSSDFENKEKLVSLMLFQSSHDPEKLTTLTDYVERMKEEQQEIFYLTGESRTVVENSPHLEAFKEEGYEVLYLVDPVDELVVQFLTEFAGKRLKSAGKGTVKLGNQEVIEQTEKELKQKGEEVTDLLKCLQQHLDEYVKDVRLTNRLTTSPVCLVGSEMDYSPQMERLLQIGKNGKPRQRRIMELNPRHEIFIKMQERSRQGADENVLKNYAELLLGHALIADRSELPDPIRFNHLVADLMVRSL